ncbi:hypothetical protein [Legionella gresilensis]|nr:hypothetical protein [Legionella gresilensis]
MIVEKTIDICVDTAKMKTSDIWLLNSRPSAAQARGRKGGRHKDLQNSRR